MDAGGLMRVFEATERGVIVLSNPAKAYPREAELERWLAGQPDGKDAVVFRTSGTRGATKWVCLSREALECSARSVNGHLDVGKTDVWLGCLPLFHVGGFSIPVRARLARIPCHWLEGRWNPEAFGEQCRRRRATLTSLVPTQVYDLLQAKVPIPPTLRVVLVGGSALAAGILVEARRIGWPLLTTYGMTETASQVATEPMEHLASPPEGKPWLEILPAWEVDVSRGAFRLRGPAIFSAYVLDADGRFQRVDPKTDGWFQTHDFVELDEGKRRLRFVKRREDLLKIKGELVSLEACRERLSELAGEKRRSVTIVPVDDARDGSRLLLVGEVRIYNAVERLEELREAYNGNATGIERIACSVVLPGEIPRGPLGKIIESELQARVLDEIKGPAGSIQAL